MTDRRAKGPPVTQPNEAILAMARRCAAKYWQTGDPSDEAAARSILSGAWDDQAYTQAALAAIIETQERCAALAEADAEKSNACFEAGIGGDAGKDRNAARYRTALRIAAAIRSGQQFRKDV